MKKKIENLCTKEMVIKILMCFIIIQPLLDIYILFEPNVVAFFRFSPSTLIRMVGIGILVFLSIKTIRWEKCHWWFLIYGMLVVIYVVLHHLNALDFTSKIPGDFGYSLFSEIFYIIRMLLPLVLIFISYNFLFPNDKFEKTITWLVVLFSGSIVVTNLLCVSLSSYTNELIEGNIFSWFLDDELPFTVLTSKGFFTFANQIAAIELLLTPIVLYFFIKNPNKKNFCFSLLQLFATFMLGTKVSTMGFVILLILMFVLFLFFCFAKKEIKWDKHVIYGFVVMLVLTFVLLPVSPMLNRNQSTESIQKGLKKTVTCKEIIFDKSDPLKYKTKKKKIVVKNKKLCKTAAYWEEEKLKVVEEQLANLSTEEEKQEYLKSFIKSEYFNFRINDYFVKSSYPYKNDPYFWYDIMKEPVNVRMEFRVLEERMLKEVKEYNGNSKDDLFGISYTRMSNIFNLERDFLSHYYSLGLIGIVLFLLPYIILLVVGLILMLKNFKEKFTLYNCSLAASIGIVLFAAYYSGNIMDGLVITLILAFIIGQFLGNVVTREEPNNK